MTSKVLSRTTQLLRCSRGSQRREGHKRYSIAVFSKFNKATSMARSQIFLPFWNFVIVRSRRLPVHY